MSSSPLSDPPTLGEHQGFEVYPMPVFARLPVADVTASIAFWRDVVGFGLMFTGPEVGGQPMIAHLRGRKYQDVLLVPGSPAPAPAPLWAFAHDDVAALADRIRAAAPLPGRAAVEGPEQTPWGTTDLQVTDPDGYTVTFTQPPATPPTVGIDEAMERTAERLRAEG